MANKGFVENEGKIATTKKSKADDGNINQNYQTEKFNCSKDSFFEIQICIKKLGKGYFSLILRWRLKKDSQLSKCFTLQCAYSQHKVILIRGYNMMTNLNLILADIPLTKFVLTRSTQLCVDYFHINHPGQELLIIIH